MTMNQIQARKAQIEVVFIDAHNELMSQYEAKKFNKKGYESAANAINRWMDRERKSLSDALYNCL